MSPSYYLGPAFAIGLLLYIAQHQYRKKKALKFRESRYMVELAERKRLSTLNTELPVAGDLVINLESLYPNEPINLKNPGYEKIVEARNAAHYNMITSFELSGVHTNTIRGYFDTLVKQYQIIELVPEPTNPVSSKAIAVRMGRKRLGYIPATLTDKVQVIHDSGKYLAYINQIDWDDSNKDYAWLSVTIVIEYTL